MQSVRQLWTTLSHIETRVARLEREVVATVDDALYLDDMMRVTDAFRRCVRSLRRQLNELEGH
jgi:hypothetical protein